MSEFFIVFLLLFSTYTYFHQIPGANANSRLDELHAIVKRKTLSIDAYHRNTIDKAKYKGRYFSEKAPGIVILSLPGFIISSELIEYFGISIEKHPGWEMSDWMTTAASVSLITAIGGAICFILLLKVYGRKVAIIVTFGLFVGAGPFPYATALFSHGAVVGLLTIATWLLAPIDLAYPRCIAKGKRREIIAGLSCGFAVASEHPAAIIAAGIFILVLRRGPLSTMMFILGTIFPLSLDLLHNYVAFGSPFMLGYKYQVAFPGMSQGFYGISFPPSWSSVQELLIGPKYGFFTWTPLLFLVFPGYKSLMQKSVTTGLIFLIPTIALTLVIAGYFLPSGGWALGPRHLASALPLQIIPLAMGVKKFPRLGTFLSILSFFLTGLCAIVSSHPPPKANPLRDYYIPRIIQGDFIPSLGSISGLQGWYALLPLGIIYLFLVIYWKKLVHSKKYS